MAPLLELRQSTTNWDAYAAGNNILGWNTTTPLCQWSGIGCDDRGRALTL